MFLNKENMVLHPKILGGINANNNFYNKKEAISNLLSRRNYRFK